MRIYINRLQEEFASDVLTIYKKPSLGLFSSLRVKFENERGVGEGPVQEFFSLLMGMVQNGFLLEEAQQTLVFEGETGETEKQFQFLMHCYVVVGFSKVLEEW